MMPESIVPIFLFIAVTATMAVGLLVAGALLGPRRSTPVKQMPYESGMDPVHDARRRFDVRFYLVAIAFLVFDVEVLLLYPWAVASYERPSRPLESAAASAVEPSAGPEPAGAAAEASSAGVLEAAMARGSAAGYMSHRGMIFGGAMAFITLLTVGLVYDWRQGVFSWR